MYVFSCFSYDAAAHIDLLSYAFDVDPTTQAFLNRRVFAFIDTGIPDGLQLDTRGNLYAGCGDGIHVSFLCS